MLPGKGCTLLLSSCEYTEQQSRFFLPTKHQINSSQTTNIFPFKNTFLRRGNKSLENFLIKESGK